MRVIIAAILKQIICHIVSYFVLKINWHQSVTSTANFFTFHVVVIICWVAEIGWSLRARVRSRGSSPVRARYSFLQILRILSHIYPRTLLELIPRALSVLLIRREANFCHSAVTEVKNEWHSASSSSQVFVAYARTISLYSHMLMLSFFHFYILFRFLSILVFRISTFLPQHPAEIEVWLRYFVTATRLLCDWLSSRHNASERNVSDGKRINGIQECTHISSLLMYELKTLTSVIFETSFCITDRSIQFQFSS